MEITRIEAALAPFGLIIRGGFMPAADDHLASDVKTLVLIGNAGPDLWEAFSRSPERTGRENPLDAWSRRVIGAAAEKLGAEAVYPFDGPPYMPFQRWAQKAEAVWPSPIGPLVHPQFGLWHAYRGALLFRRRIDFGPLAEARSPCEDCPDQPCLSGCPVAAFSPGHYDVPACVRHLQSDEGAICMNGGCRARKACPFGTAFQYEGDHAHFHMVHFLKNHT